MSMSRLRLLACCSLPVLLLLSAPAAWAQSAKEAPADPPPPPPAEIMALLGGDDAQQASALATLRADPAAARAGLVAALQREEPLPERWRLIYRLIEFGQPEDVPLLLQLRENAQNPWERRIAEGAAQALYDPVGTTAGLETVVQDFSFIQTRPATRLDDPDAGKYMLTRWSLGNYHRGDVPLKVIKQVQPLRGKAFDSRDALAAALEKRIGARDWKTLHEELLAAVEAVPPRARIEGLARVRLANPLQRPLLLRVSLDAWFGHFTEPPRPAWVYLEPQASQTIDIPVTPQGSLERPEIRLDLRLAEVNGPFIPSFHKLYLPLQP